MGRAHGGPLRAHRPPRVDPADGHHRRGYSTGREIVTYGAKPGAAGVIVLYGVVVGWTLVETSVGLIHALVDRIDENIEDFEWGALEGKEGLTSLQSGLLGGGILVGAMLLSRVGIITLVAQGYTIMAYFFILLFAIPLLTVGVYRIANPDWRRDRWAGV